MKIKTIVATAIATAALLVGLPATAQDELACEDLEWSAMVTDQYPNIANACDAVVQKNGKLYARVKVELQRVRGRTLTFKVINNDGSSGGIYTQTVNTSWRANIGGQSYRPEELYRGQSLNVYIPHDRWAVIHEDVAGVGPAEAQIEEPAPVVEAAVLPKTASPLFLIGLLGAGLLALGAALGLARRRLAA